VSEKGKNTEEKNFGKIISFSKKKRREIHENDLSKILSKWNFVK